MNNAFPLRPSGLIGTPAWWEVQDAISRGLPLDLSDSDFIKAAFAGGFGNEMYVSGMLSFYQTARYEAETGNPF